MNAISRIPLYLIRGLIRVYQLLISPVLAGSCRYHPTCSQYALEAVEEHGPFKGAWLALKRIGRCHPWGSSGFDPVPLKHGNNPPNEPKEMSGI